MCRRRSWPNRLAFTGHTWAELSSACAILRCASSHRAHCAGLGSSLSKNCLFERERFRTIRLLQLRQSSSFATLWRRSRSVTGELPESAQEVLLDRRCQIPKIHDLSNSSAGDATLFGDLREIIDRTLFDERFVANCKRHQLTEPRSFTRRCCRYLGHPSWRWSRVEA